MSLIPVPGEVYSIEVIILYHITLCDKVCQWLATGRWFSPGTLVSSTNKTDRHDITEILLKVVLSTITLILSQFQYLHLKITPLSCYLKSATDDAFQNYIIHSLVIVKQRNIILIYCILCYPIQKWFFCSMKHLLFCTYRKRNLSMDF